MSDIMFRGTGDTMGVPRAYCGCPVCEEARGTGVNRRLRSSVQWSDEGMGHTFLDIGPDWGRQMEAAGLKRIDQALITHAHFDHIGGLVEWADSCRWLNEKGRAYAPSEVIDEINARFPWVNRQITFIPADEPFTLGEWDIRAWRVNHGKNGYSYAYRMDHRHNGFGWVYCPDSIGLSEQEWRPMSGTDLLILGTSFYHEPFPYETRSVYDVIEALELLKAVKPKRTIFTHMSHDIDLNAAYPLPEHVGFGQTGLRVHLSHNGL